MHRAPRIVATATTVILLAAGVWGADPALAGSDAEPRQPRPGSVDARPVGEDPAGTELAGTILQNITEAAEAGAETDEDFATALGLPSEGGGSLLTDADGRLTVTVTFTSRPTQADLAAVSALGSLERVHRLTPSADVTIAPADLDAVAELAGVSSVVPILRPITGGQLSPAALRSSLTASGLTVDAGLAAAAIDGDSCRSLPVEADAPHRADRARDVYRVDGTGITIGIISDSYGVDTAVTTPEDDIAAGLLPGPGNPCGYTTPVRVIDDADSGKDEGRAMAQLVHGIAPGAELLFAAGASIAGMADAILDLADAGADIIVDDLGFAGEQYYQQSIISVAIAQVRERGIAYYSSIGNSGVFGAAGTPSSGKPIAAWQTAAYRGTECPDWVEVSASVDDYDCLDFDPGEDADPTQTIGLDSATAPVMQFSWAEPQYGVETSFSLMAYTTDDDPLPVTVPNVLDPDVPVQVSGFTEEPVVGDYQLVLVRDLTGVPEDEITSPAVWITFFTTTDVISWLEYDETAGPDIVGAVAYGHSGHGEAVGVAASYWASPTNVEAYSSPGPAFLRFEPVDPVSREPSDEYDEALIVDTPSISGVDGTQTSFFPSEDGDGEYRFFGTSAAAPHVAAIHALAADYAPNAAPEQIIEAIVDTAAEMTNPIPHRLSDEALFGAGLADAYGALTHLPTPTVTGLTAEALSATSIAVSWDPVDTASGYEVELRAGGEVWDAATLAADETALTYTELEPETVFTVTVAVVDGEGDAGTAVEASVTTPRPPRPGTAPAAPGSETLTPGATNALGISTSTVEPGGTVTVTGLPTMTWAYGYAYSTPTALGWSWTGAGGAATFTVPSGLAPGAHRLAITDQSGSLLGWVSLTVTAGVKTEGGTVPAGTSPRRLSDSGAAESPTGLLPAAALAVLAGAGLLVATRRRGPGSVAGR